MAWHFRYHGQPPRFRKTPPLCICVEILFAIALQPVTDHDERFTAANDATSGKNSAAL